MVDIKYRGRKLSGVASDTQNRLDFSRRKLWSEAGLLGRVLGERRFYELSRAKIKTHVETSELDTALAALKVSDNDARELGLNDYEIAVARYWAMLIRTKLRSGVLQYRSTSQPLNVIFNNPGTKR